MKIKLLTFTLLLSFLSFGQYEQDNTKFGLLLRGKVAAGPASPENDYFQNISIGTELKFLNYHSIGIDRVYFRFRYSNESLDTITNYWENDGTHTFDKKVYLNLDYRFYLNFWPHNYHTLFYINVFTKIGIQNRWARDDNAIPIDEPSYYKSNFNNYGIAFGSHIGFGNGRGGLDVNIGIMKQFKTIEKGYHLWNGQSNVPTPNFRVELWKPHMRLNFYINLFKIK